MSKTFLLVWLGQVISLIGSGLTGFALGVWVYQETGSATQFALIIFFAELPAIVIAPLAGVLADRWNRRGIMILSDSGAGLSTLAIALLLLTGWLEIWHIYLAMAISSICKGLQKPTYYSMTTLLVEKKHFGRASGMVQLSQGGKQLFSPVLAGMLIVMIQLQGVILIDFVTFLFALVTLLIVRFPQPKRSNDGKAAQGSLLHEAIYGWTYIMARPGLVMMVLFFAITNFTIGIAQVLITPLLLSFTNVKVLGTVLSLGGSGWLFGALVMSVWGGPKRQIYGILAFELLLGLSILLVGLRPSPVLIATAGFAAFFSIPIIIGSAHAIWQKKVAPDVQGRVFAVRSMISWSCFPLAYLVAGPLADYVFEPLLVHGGPLAGSIGQFIGVGPGRGIGLLFIAVGAFIMLVTITAYHYRPLRQVEDDLPDAIADEMAASGQMVAA